MRKSKMWLEKGVPCGDRAAISGTNTLVVAPGDKHNTDQRQEQDQEVGMDYRGGDQDHQKSPKPPNHFQKGLEELIAWEVRNLSSG